MNAELVVDLFAGPGGWDTGVRIAGYGGPLVGIEHDMSACRTAVAAGHARICADVAAYPTAPFVGKVDGLIASPPCQAWSTAGDRKGEIDREAVYARITAFARGRQPADHGWADERSKLTAEPMRWAAALRPRWIALEQVPPVLPLWEHMAALLRELGYRTWTGTLSAEEYGVPQTRKRAILVARRDGMPASPPEPTRQSYRSGRPLETVPNLFGDPLPPPASMAEALGWSESGAVSLAPAGVASKMVDPRPTSEPAHTITGVGSAAWVLRNGPQENATYRGLGDPAATIYCSRPGNLNWQSDEGSWPVSVVEAGVIQSFPADYPWQGTKSKQHEQVGNAIPPLLAAAILRPLLNVSSQAREVAA